MPRRYEIEGAFRDAVRKEANGRRTVTTVDFVEKLAAVNWHWSLKEANNWIECYITTFKDISDQEGEERTFMLYNPNNGGIEMGFVSPAQDYVESRISLDQQFIVHPSETYFMRAATTYIRAGIAQGALLIVDASVNPCDGSVVVCSLGGEFQLRRYRLSPYAHFEHLSGDGRKDKIDHEWVDENDGIFGVVTHAVNDMRTMEFDDCPVI